ncbi:hypothetical protein BLD49_01300 [Erwinia sp. OLMDSP33]|nr:hypothetical protein BLD49_01300 [Erwinia sp. OLMDSP33]
MGKRQITAKNHDYSLILLIYLLKNASVAQSQRNPWRPPGGYLYSHQAECPKGTNNNEAISAGTLLEDVQ